MTKSANNQFREHQARDASAVPEWITLPFAKIN